MAERKDLIQDIKDVKASDLLSAVNDVKTAGYRLGQACATKTDGGIEVLYSFEKDEVLANLKVSIEDKAPELQSITAIYWAAFIYENEMHDLFGIEFKNLALDYGGHFFKIAAETPWNPALDRSAAAKEEKPKEVNVSEEAKEPENVESPVKAKTPEDPKDSEKGGKE